MIKSEWSKSSYSEGATNCVECRAGEGTAQVRDTQYPEHGHLAFPYREWSAFVAELHSL
ncbi:DUF397 domain-containing protein [Streptomonospora algeriensis]|uniref:DUF397 domain-containing protein n=1 Tax=Streptomonospora algeriensis TaxID=995084 RepID=A0ABW3BIL9_9ACTN